MMEASSAGARGGPLEVGAGTLACVACTRPLTRVESRHGVHWECQACGGQAISLAVLGAIVERAYLKRLWGGARQAKERSGRPCFHCGEPMALVESEPVPRRGLHSGLDVCTRCMWVWFDGRELEEAPAAGERSRSALPGLVSAAGMPLKSQPRPSQARPFAPLLIVTLLAALSVIAAAHLVWWRDAPSGSIRGAEILRSAGYPRRAEEVLLALLDQRPLDLDLNHRYLVNHFAIRSRPGQPRDDAGVAARYRRLSAHPETSDLGHYGLGFVAAGMGRDAEALDYYGRVSNPRQKYLNGAIGRSLLRLGRTREAQAALAREIELGGNLGDAVEDLAQLHLAARDLAAVRALLMDPGARGSVPREVRREAALRSGWLTEYLAADLALLRQVTPVAAVTALVIAAMWFLFLWRIDIFEKEPFRHSLLIFGLGGASVFVSLLGAELLALAVPAEGPVRWWLHAGLPEEAAKILPVLAIARMSWHVNEPVDLLVYGSLSALGFATVENALYFSDYGPDVAVPRFLGSTIGHMALTGLVCHLLGRARFVHRSNPSSAIAKGLALAVLLHGAANYVVSTGSVGMVVAAAVTAALYGWMISDALAFSPYYHDSLATSSRLRNFELLAATAIVLVLISFLDDRRRLGTSLAEQRLLQMGGSFWMACLVFGTVGKLGLARRRVGS